MMRLALVGYGRMGRLIESLAVGRGHTVGVIVDPKLPHSEALNEEPKLRRSPKLSEALLTDVDAAIEFSLPDGVVENTRVYAEAGVPAVIGTTGWLTELETVRAIAHSSGIGLLYGSNFSVGANLFFRIVSQAARLADPFDEYDLAIHEMHHAGKQDSPSGTALTTAERVLAEVARKSKLYTDRLDRAPYPDELHVSSTRGGSVPGTHTLFLDSEADSIEIRHSARSRSGFALGAIRGAEWIADRSGLFSVDDFIDELVQKKETP